MTPSVSARRNGTFSVSTSFQKTIFTVLAVLFSVSVFAHDVTGYTASCTTGPVYSIDATVINVNSASNYAWQYKNASGAWVCIVNGNNTINGNTYSVSGATSTATTNPAPIVFNNPNSALHGLVIRCVISDGAGVNPCNMPAGNTWNSGNPSVNHTIAVTNTPCATTTCTAQFSSLYFNKLDGGTDLPITNGATFTTAQLGSLYNLETATTGTVGSVAYTITGPTPSSNIENTAPYNSPATGGGAWTGTAGTYAVNVKIYSGANATGTICDEETITFILNDGCSCPGNVVLNPSFESGTTSWSWSGGNFSAGGGAIACGVKSGDFEITNAASNWVSQTIGTNLAPGTEINVSVYAGTHDNSFYHQVAVQFFDANWNYMSQAAVEVNKVLSAAPAGPQQYQWTAIVPQGAKYTNVAFNGTGSWIKTDLWCVTFSAPGSIADRVWNDTDRDGIQDASELGLAGVTVSLYNNAGSLIASTVTDAYGLYKFSNLPVSSAGVNYQVRFSQAPGYVYSPQNADAAGVAGAANSDANVTTGRTGNITLTTAVPNVTYVDAGLYLTQPNRIGDFIWNDLNKDGDQDPGEPGIAGVVVTLYDNSGVAVRTTITDNNGHYEFNDVPAGTYTLGVTPPAGYQFSAQDAAADNLDSDFIPATGRTAPFAVTTGVNLTLDGGLNVTDVTKAAVGDYVWIDLDNDNVQDANEPGVPGVTVQLYTSANVLTATTTTNALGYYVFNNVLPGTYYVKFSGTPAGYNVVTADAGADDTKDSDVTGANGAGTTASFTLIADAVNMTIDAGLRATTALNSIGDFVWYDLNKNGIQDPGEAGVPGITVTLYNATTGAVVKTTTTNAQGLYMFTDVAAGSYTIGFSNLPAGYAFSPADAGADGVDSDVNPATGRTATITVAGSGNVITTWDAGIVSNPNVFDSKASIGDFVWNDLNNNGIQDAGEPGVAGVTVTLYAADGTTVVATTTTDALGNYQFSNLNAGTYVVGFSGLPSGYVIGTKDAGSNDAKDSDADAGTGKTGPVTLLPGQINTTVDAAVRNTNTTLGRIGNYVWIDSDANGFQGTTEPGVPGVSVFLIDNAGNVIKNTVTDANGFYLFTDLAAGNYRVSFGNLPAGFVATTKDAAPVNDATDSDADGGTLTTDVFVLAAGGIDLSRDLGIKSTTTAAVGDYVWSDVDGNGQQGTNEPGIPGVLVTLYNSAGTAVATTVTDANGKYLFVNVTPGSYTMGFGGLPIGSSFTTKDNGADASDNDVNPATGKTDAFTLVAGQTNTTIDAGLVTKFAAVGDFVWNDLNANGIQDAGEPGVAGVTVTLYNSSNVAVASAVTDGNGYYFINNIPVPAAGANYTIGFTDKPTGSVFTTKNAAGSTTANDSNADVTTGLTDAFTLVPGQIRQDIDAGLTFFVTLSGNVWHDVNAMNDNLVNNSGAAQAPPAAGIPVGLRAYLVNTTTGLIEKVTLVSSATGTYNFNNVTPNKTYRVYLTSLVLPVGTAEASIPNILPSGWEHTGQKNANPPNLPTGSDGINDGRITVPVGGTSVININFGIKISGGDTVIG